MQRRQWNTFLCVKLSSSHKGKTVGWKLRKTQAYSIARVSTGVVPELSRSPEEAPADDDDVRGQFVVARCAQQQQQQQLDEPVSSDDAVVAHDASPCSCCSRAVGRRRLHEPQPQKLARSALGRSDRIRRRSANPHTRRTATSRVRILQFPLHSLSLSLSLSLYRPRRPTHGLHTICLEPVRNFESKKDPESSKDTRILFVFNVTLLFCFWWQKLVPVGLVVLLLHDSISNAVVLWFLT